MKLELDPSHAEAVKQAVASGVAETPEQYITQLIDRDQAETEKHQAYVEEMIDLGIASGFEVAGPNHLADLKQKLQDRIDARTA